MSRREHPRVVGLLREQYRAAARAGDWTLCVALAEQMQGLDRSKSVGAEVQYALGFAHEKLGDVAKALGCYRTAVMIDARNPKANAPSHGCRLPPRVVADLVVDDPLVFALR